MPENTRTLTRRQVATAAAWSVPVVAMAVAAPAASASGGLFPDPDRVGIEVAPSNPLPGDTFVFRYRPYDQNEDEGVSSLKPGWTITVLLANGATYSSVAHSTNLTDAVVTGNTLTFVVTTEVNTSAFVRFTNVHPAGASFTTTIVNTKGASYGSGTATVRTV